MTLLLVVVMSSQACTYCPLPFHCLCASHLWVISKMPFPPSVFSYVCKGLWSDLRQISIYCLLVTIICGLPQRTDYGEKWIAFCFPFLSVCMQVQVCLCAHAYGGQRSAFMLCLGSLSCCFLRQHLSKRPGPHWLSQASLPTSPLDLLFLAPQFCAANVQHDIGLLIGCWEPSSGLHTCIRSNLWTEQSPQRRFLKIEKQNMPFGASSLVLVCIPYQSRLQP